MSVRPLNFFFATDPLPSNRLVSDYPFQLNDFFPINRNVNTQNRNKLKRLIRLKTSIEASYLLGQMNENCINELFGKLVNVLGGQINVIKMLFLHSKINDKLIDKMRELIVDLFENDGNNNCGNCCNNGLYSLSNNVLQNISEFLDFDDISSFKNCCKFVAPLMMNELTKVNVSITTFKSNTKDFMNINTKSPFKFKFSKYRGYRHQTFGKLFENYFQFPKYCVYIMRYNMCTGAVINPDTKLDDLNLNFDYIVINANRVHFVNKNIGPIGTQYYFLQYFNTVEQQFRITDLIIGDNSKIYGHNIAQYISKKCNINQKDILLYIGHSKAYPIKHESEIMETGTNIIKYAIIPNDNFKGKLKKLEIISHQHHKPFFYDINDCYQFQIDPINEYYKLSLYYIHERNDINMALKWLDNIRIDTKKLWNPTLRNNVKLQKYFIIKMTLLCYMNNYNKLKYHLDLMQKYQLTNIVPNDLNNYIFLFGIYFIMASYFYKHNDINTYLFYYKKIIVNCHPIMNANDIYDISYLDAQFNITGDLLPSNDKNNLGTLIWCQIYGINDMLYKDINTAYLLFLQQNNKLAKFYINIAKKTHPNNYYCQYYDTLINQ